MMKNAKKQTSYWFKIGEHGIMAYVLADSLEEAKNILLEGHKLYNPRKKKLRWTILMKCTNLHIQNSHIELSYREICGSFYFYKGELLWKRKTTKSST